MGRERKRRKMEKTFKGKRLGDRKKERERDVIQRKNVRM